MASVCPACGAATGLRGKRWWAATVLAIPVILDVASCVRGTFQLTNVVYYIIYLPFIFFCGRDIIAKDHALLCGKCQDESKR